MEKWRKAKGGVSVYILGIYVSFFLIIVFVCTISEENISHIQKEFDTGILVSLLGSANINREEYGRSQNRVIHETYRGEEPVWNAAENADCQDEYLEKTLALFQNLLLSNLGLDSAGNSRKNVLLSPVAVEEFKVFNVYEEPESGKKQIYEFTWNGAWNVTVHSNADVYVAGAGDKGTVRMKVEDTTLYAVIAFDINVFPYLPETGQERSVRVRMSRSVSVPENERFE